MKTQEFKIGDKVLRHGDRYQNDSIRTVSKITKTQVILNNGNRFRRVDGMIVGGGSWVHIYISPATEGMITKVRHNQEKRRCVKILNNIKWNEYSLNSLTKILMGLPKTEEKGG